MKRKITITEGQIRRCVNQAINSIIRENKGWKLKNESRRRGRMLREASSPYTDSAINLDVDFDEVGDNEMVGYLEVGYSSYYGQRFIVGSVDDAEAALEVCYDYCNHNGLDNCIIKMDEAEQLAQEDNFDNVFDYAEYRNWIYMDGGGDNGFMDVNDISVHRVNKQDAIRLLSATDPHEINAIISRMK